MPETLPVDAAGESNRGLHYRRNEDNFVLVNYPGANAILAVVADGVGGNVHGDLASYVCCRSLCGAFLAESPAPGRDRDSAAGFLRRVFDRINTEIFNRSCAAHVRHPMASTLLAMLCTSDCAVIANVGDSRCYLYCGGELRQLTVDHVTKRDTEGEAPISRAIGLRSRLDLDVVTVDRPAGTRFLLASDGLYKGVGDARLAGIMRDSTTAREAVSDCIRTALLAGGRDNLTAITLFSTDGVS